MKLTLFTPDQFVETKKSALPTFIVSKGNVLKLNAPLCTLLHVEPGDTVILGQDEKSPGDWYIGRHAKGFALKTSAGTDPALSFISKGFAQLMRDAFPNQEPPIKIPVSPELTDLQGATFYALLTRALAKK